MPRGRDPNRLDFALRRAERVVNRLTSAVTDPDAQLDESGRTDDQASQCVDARLAARRRHGVRAAGYDRGPWPGARPAGGDAAWRDGDREESGHRHVPRDRVRCRTAPSSSAASCRGDTRSVPSCRASRSSCAATSNSRSARRRRIDVPLEVGSLSETVNVVGGIADRRRDLEGGRRQHHRARAGRAAERSTATSSASSACCPASSRRSAPNRSAATRSR